VAKVKSSKAAKAAIKNKVVSKAQPKLKLASSQAKPNLSEKKRLDTTESAAFLGCSLPLIYAMLRDGRVKAKETIGNRIFLDPADLQKLLDNNIVQPRKKHPQTISPESMQRTKNQVVSFEVSAPASDVNYLSMVLASQGLTITDWVTKMITQTVAAEQQSAAVRLLGSR
jgi:hypothetical protein